MFESSEIFQRNLKEYQGTSHVEQIDLPYILNDITILRK